jgi:hypothetical protein
MSWMDNFTSRLGDFGYGIDQVGRRNALKQALMQAGLRMMGGAQTEGFGALAPALAEGLSAYQGGLGDQFKLARQREEDDLRRDQFARQEALTQAQIDNYQADNERARTDALAKAAALKAKVEERRAALAALPEEKRARLAPLVGSDDFDRYLYEATEPPKVEDPKAPTVRDFEDGTTRQWDHGKSEWVVLARRPPKEPDAPKVDEGGMTPGEQRYDASLRARQQAIYRAYMDRINVKNKLHLEKPEAQPQYSIPLPDAWERAEVLARRQMGGGAAPAPAQKRQAAAPTAGRPAPAPTIDPDEVSDVRDMLRDLADPATREKLGLGAYGSAEEAAAALLRRSGRPLSLLAAAKVRR